MTRVLHVTSVYAGGISRAMATAILAAPQHEHHLLWSGNERPATDHGFISVTPLPNGFVKRVQAVRRTVRELRPDVIHAHSSWAGVFTRIFDVGADVIYQPHCYKFDDPTISGVARTAYRLVEKFLMRRTALVVVLSPHENALAQALDARVARIFVPNAPSIEPVIAPSVGEDLAEVLMVGRVSPQKDPAFFAAVADLVRESRPDVVFRWIGAGPEPLSAVLRRSGVEITGWQNREKLRQTLSGPAIYLHTAVYEGFPLSVLDAAAFGMPIIARTIPPLEGTPLVQIRDVNAAAEAVLEVLSRGESCDRAIAGGARLLETMNSRAQAHALESIYNTFGTEARTYEGSVS
ncbi:glycosyltransferase [Cryobacterium sp. 1639]|uniref:glycosyltransferase n=1 Tax=Cryobacterium inferilacus TaxID=2866629 RepID=UPI001C72F666|nr:glycosyltransferase [Cryobacterium sp. 1639]MBX0301733.1 glycosyltransferase [Cryobacterium sp. 1639]